MDTVKDGYIGLSMECEDDELLPWQLESHRQQNEPVWQTLAVKVLTQPQNHNPENSNCGENVKEATGTSGTCSDKDSLPSEIEQMNFINNFEPLPLQILTVDELTSLDLCGLYPDLSKDSEEFLIDGYDFIQHTLANSNEVNLNTPLIQFNWVRGLSEKPLCSFSGETPGLKNSLQAIKNFNPCEFFKMFMTSEFLAEIVSNTNNFAKFCNAADWKNVNISEIQAFIGLCVIMGVSPRTELIDYWSTDPALSNPFISKVMALKKFQQISRYINFSSLGQPNYSQNQNYEFTVEKVTPVLKTFCEKTIALYNLHQDVVILDATNSFCHQSGIKMNFPRNPSRLGWSLFLLRDSITGYIMDMYIKMTEGKPIENYLDVAEAFTTNLKFKFHHLYLDKGLCSLDMCHYLFDHGIYVCGSSDARLIGIPIEFKEWSRSLSNEQIFIKPGDCLTSQKESTAIVVWAKMEENIVFMSTMHKAYECNIQFIKESGVEHSFGCSKFISQYFRQLACHSAFRQNFSVQRISHSWWKYFLWFLIDVSINNAYVLWSEVQNDGKTRKDFQLEVGKGLVNGFSNHARNFEQHSGAPQDGLLNPQHMLIKMKGRARICHMCRILKSEKPRESTYGCSVCCVNLCRGQCFLQFHLQAVNKISTIQRKENLAKTEMKEMLPVQPLSSSESSRVTEREAKSSLKKVKQKKHSCIRLAAKKKTCIQCQMDGKTWNNQHPKETIWGCITCKVFLHQEQCFEKYHLKKLDKNINQTKTSLPVLKATGHEKLNEIH